MVIILMPKSDSNITQSKKCQQLRDYQLQLNFSGLNTDGSFTTAVSNSFWSPLVKKKTLAADLGYFRVIFFFYIENGILCVFIRIASMRRF